MDQPLHHAAPAVRAGARFKPKGRPQPKKKQVSLTSQSTLSTDVANEKLSTQSEDPVSLDGSSACPNKVSTSETIAPDNGTINQTTIGTISKDNVDVFSRGVNWCMEPSVLRRCTNVDLEGKRCDDGIEAASAFPDDPRTQDPSTFGDFVTPDTDEVIHVQTQKMQTGEEECHLYMETLDIVHEEGITSAYEQHTGKFQPKPGLLDFHTDTICGELQGEELNILDVPREMVPEMEAQNAPGGWEHEEQVVSPRTNNADIVDKKRSGRESKMGKSKRGTARKRKTTSEEDPNKSSEKRFKHSCRRQRKRKLEKELLETPDDEIRFLPIRDMLRLVEYKEWMEKKEAKGTAVAPPIQESNTNASDYQYYPQGFDAEDEFGIEESENQETNLVKPDSPVNYQTYMNKTCRTRWSKQDTELFYEGIREFGSNLSMVQQLFPNRTREQIKLKFKLEDRRYPLKLNDALSSRSKHLTHFQNVIKKLQQDAAAAREEGEEAGAEAETTSDILENEEPAKSEETELADGVKESDGGDECDDEGDDNFWNSYKSDM